MFWDCKYTSFLCDKKIYLPFFSKIARILFVKSLIYNILCRNIGFSVSAYICKMVVSLNLFCMCSSLVFSRFVVCMKHGFAVPFKCESCDIILFVTKKTLLLHFIETML